MAVNTDKSYYGIKLKKRSFVKDLSVRITASLKFTKQCMTIVNEANRILGYIKRNFSFKNKDARPPIYDSLVRYHWKYAVPLWSPHRAKDIGKLKAVQRRDKMLSLCNKHYNERV